MQVKLIKYIEKKYPRYTARPGMEHQAYQLETRMAGLTADDLEQLKEQGLILVKKTPETARPDSVPSREEKELTEFLRKKYDNGIPAEIIKETAEILAARNNIKNPLAFILQNCQIFFEEKLLLNASYKFNLTKEVNSLIIHYKEKKCSLIHKLSELLLRQISKGEHDFIFYLTEAKEIGLRVDGANFILPELSATPSQP
ncbi:MAG: hypothetical protein LBJ25_08135 [Candidatus Margulisbacteria bacterium]|jgi:hypothetical protein|nr:hypothetical protein [Candidatus Margulisiibacteriota bacterium]